MIFDFEVPLRWDDVGPVAWLTDDCKLTEEPERAVRLRFRLCPTGADDLRIQRRIDDVNDGIGNTIDIEIAIEQTRTAVQGLLRDTLYPDDPPDLDLTSAQEEQRAEAIATAFVAIGTLTPRADDEEGRLLLQRKRAYQRLTALRDRQEIAAQWPIMIVEPPLGWEDLYDKELMPAHRDAVIAAFLVARMKASDATGK